MSDASSCRECSEEYDGNPPCDECKKPDDLWEENKNALAWWRICHQHRQFQAGLQSVIYLPILLDDLVTICSLHDGSTLDFKKMLLIEKKIYPTLNTKAVK